MRTKKEPLVMNKTNIFQLLKVKKKNTYDLANQTMRNGVSKPWKKEAEVHNILQYFEKESTWVTVDPALIGS